MNILQYGSLAGSVGGPAHSLYLLSRGLREAGISCEVLMPELTAGDKLYGTEVPVRFLPRSYGHFQYSFGIQHHLDSMERPDICHVHGVWQYPNHALCVYARRHGIPYLISPRGMLYKQGIDGHSKLLKHLVLFFWQNRDLAAADCLHATCNEELQVLRDMGLHNPVAVIPNAVGLTGGVLPPTPPADRFRVCYLGRLHPRKHVESLIRAFAAVALPDSELVIIGDGDEGYKRRLHRECGHLGLNNVRFAGFLYDGDKRTALRRMSLLVVPSDFENFGNVVVEALAEGVPVAASRGTPWQELERHHCGWWIDNSTDEIARILRTASSLSREERIAMGEAGQKLLSERYSVERTTAQWRAVYLWLSGGGERPDSIFD